MKRLPLLVLLVPTLALAGGRVSAFKAENKLGTNYWNVQSALDGKTETAWMVPGESANKGEWLEIDLPTGEVDKISIYPGYGKSTETWTDYPRVKTLRVDVYAINDTDDTQQVGSTTVEVADKAEVQLIDVPDVKTGAMGGRARLVVLDVYPGDDYPNLAVSEAAIILKEIDGKATLTEVSSEDGKDALMDGDPKTVWKADAASFTLTSTGFSLSSVGFQNGGKDWARPKTVSISVGPVSKTTELPDAPEAWAPIPVFNGFNGGGFGDVVVEVKDVYPGAKNPQVALGELKVRATTYSPF